MLMRHLIALDNLNKTLPPTEEDQKLALLHANSAPCLLFLLPVHAIVLVGFILQDVQTGPSTGYPVSAYSVTSESG